MLFWVPLFITWVSLARGQLISSFTKKRKSQLNQHSELVQPPDIGPGMPMGSVSTDVRVTEHCSILNAFVQIFSGKGEKEHLTS